MVRSLITDLSESGEERWAQSLHDAMIGGSSSGEVLGNIGVVLLSLKRNNVPQRLGLGQRVDEVLQFIEDALGPPHEHLR